MSTCECLENCDYVNINKIAEMFAQLRKREESMIIKYQVDCIHGGADCDYKTKSDKIRRLVV